jgi:hypothetical protein
VAGTVVIATGDDSVEKADVPAAFVADTLKVYEVSEFSPPTTIGDDDPVVPVAVVSSELPGR